MKVEIIIDGKNVGELSIEQFELQKNLKPIDYKSIKPTERGVEEKLVLFGFVDLDGETSNFVFDSMMKKGAFKTTRLKK